MLLSACLYRVIWLDKREKGVAVLLIVSGFLCFAWSANVIMALPVLLGVVCSARRITGRSWRFFLICAFLLCLVCLPYLWVIMGHSNIGRFAQAETKTIIWSQVCFVGWNKNWRRTCGRRTPCCFF